MMVISDGAPVDDSSLSVNPANFLEKHLRDAGLAGAPMGELVQVLPAVSRAQIKRLMEQLVQEQRVHLRGVTRGGRWLAGPAMGLAQLAQKSGAAEPNQSEPNRPEL